MARWLKKAHFLDRRTVTSLAQEESMRRLLFPYVLLCGLLWLACNRIVPGPTYPTPPASSYRLETVDLVIDGKTHRIQAAFVTPEFIQVVRAQPLLGRYFIDEEYQPTFDGVAVLSHELWSQRFRSDPSRIGRSFDLNGKAFTVIGIMPKSFRAPEQAEIWLPDASGPHPLERSQSPGSPTK